STMRLISDTLDSPAVRSQSTLQTPPPRVHPARAGILEMFGIVLALVTIGVELVTGMSAEIYFDPMPSPAHILLALYVPAANFWVWWVLRRGSAVAPAVLATANAAAMGVASFYTLVYLPILPLAAIGALVILGLLPAAPLFSLITTISLRRRLRAAEPRVPLWCYGFALGLVALVAVDLPSYLTAYGLRRASDPSTAASGIQLLRRWGSEEEMQRAGGWRRSRLPLALAPSTSPTQAREIYYRVTGRLFDESASPSTRNRRSFRFPVWDAHQGGNAVGGRVEGVSLASSRLDGSIDATALTSYVEWTVAVRNTDPVQREARAEIRLPAGAMVSRATLWIDGDEREAAFGPRGKVRAAYQRVVQARRDPLLVTTSGPSRVLVQCFPIPPGGEMKFRLGITAPLAIDSARTASLQLPYFSDRNFAISPDSRHLVWIESKQMLSTESAVLSAEISRGIYALRASLTDEKLAAPSRLVRIDRIPDSGVAWTPDPHATGFAVRQRVEARHAVPFRKIIAVVDGSAGMEPFQKEIAAAMAAAPVEMDLIVASDEVLKPSLARFRDLRFEGGMDNVPALEAAVKQAARDGGAAVVWIHGAQRVLFSPPETLRQLWQRRPGASRVYAVQAWPGSSKVLAELEDAGAIQSVPRAASLRADLAALFARLVNPSTEEVPVRERVVYKNEAPAEWGPRTSSHLARLWAFDEVGRGLERHAPGSQEEAAALAAKYQLVTAVSGAVVLESQRQYQEAGLDPANPGSVPTVPEPEEWMLLAVVSVLLTIALYRRRRKWTAA
ncbi:MAG: VIT domain-containing protein, partial [Bryobacteraceae bacterium]